MKKISLTSLFVFLVSFAFSQFNPYIPVGKTINSFSEKQYQYSLETIDSHHQVPHPVLNIIFFDDFGTDKGWTGSEEDYWERGITLADLEYSEWNRSNPDCMMPENDFSSSADSTILGFNIGSCHEIGVVVAEKVITSPVIDCSGKDRVYMSFRSFSCFRASSEFTIQMYNGYTWQTVETTINNVFAYIYSDQRWVYHEADISEFAANNSEFRFRYTLSVWEKV